jgi:hypothetical protein
VLLSTPGGPKAPGREHELPLLRSCGYSSPRPFPRLSNVERVPRTFGKLLFVEALLSLTCGLIERGQFPYRRSFLLAEIRAAFGV